MINALGPGAALLNLIASLFWFIFVAALLAAVILPRTNFGRGVALSAVLVIFLGDLVHDVWQSKQRKDAFVAQRDKAVAHWQKRCMQAGLFIHRTVDNVDGLFIGEVPQVRHDEADQNAPDVFNRDFWGDSFIRTFLAGRNAKGWAIVGGHIDPLNPLRDKDGGLLPEPILRPGYRWIEGIDPKDGRRYRYSGVFELLSGTTSAVDLVVKRNPPGESPPRYALVRLDISTPEDRALWVAGGRLQIVDQVTGDVLAERIGFMVDRGQGSWLQARRYRCPEPIKERPLDWREDNFAYQTRLFVEEVLKISGGTK